MAVPAAVPIPVKSRKALTIYEMATGQYTHAKAIIATATFAPRIVNLDMEASIFKAPNKP